MQESNNIAQKLPAAIAVTILTLLEAVTVSRAAVAADAARPPNVLFVLTDDQRPDTIHALGNSIIETPNLDRLVRDGTVFTRAVSPNPICVSSRAEILTGCTSFHNGEYAGGKFAPGMTFWPETMRQAGYRTWYVGKWHTNGRPTTRGYVETQGLFAGGGPIAKDAVDWKGRPVTGYQGWVFQNDQGQKFPERGVGLTPNISADFADAAIAFIRRHNEQPFFLHLNFTAPHDPLLVPPGYAGKYDPAKIPLPANFLPEHPFDHGNFRGRDEELFAWPRTPDEVRQELACYYAVISHMDQQLGRVLAALEETGQAENTIVIFTSDQGLAIGSHGLRGKQNMYEHTVGVPLVMRGPGIPVGKKRNAQIYLRDLYPTICQLTGVKAPTGLDGRSFAPVLSGQTDSIHSEIFGYFRDVQRMVRTDRWKLIHYPQIGRYQLFDLMSDPAELHDLSTDATKAQTAAQLKSTLASWQREAGDPLAAR
jgi:arylsulfatase A-like enzyme